MLPLNMADVGQTLVIKKIGGTAEVKKHLEDLGFYVGGDVCIVSSLCYNIDFVVSFYGVSMRRENLKC